MDIYGEITISVALSKVAILRGCLASSWCGPEAKVVALKECKLRAEGILVGEATSIAAEMSITMVKRAISIVGWHGEQRDLTNAGAAMLFFNVIIELDRATE